MITFLGKRQEILNTKMKAVIKGIHNERPIDLRKTYDEKLEEGIINIELQIRKNKERMKLLNY